MKILDELKSKLMNRLTKKCAKGLGAILSFSKMWLIRLTISELRLRGVICWLQVVMILSEREKHYIINFSEKICDCRVWDLSGISCKQVVVSLTYKSDRLEAYTYDRFSKAKYMRVYSHQIKTIPRRDFWPNNLEVQHQTSCHLLLRDYIGEQSKVEEWNQMKGNASRVLVQFGARSASD